MNRETFIKAAEILDKFDNCIIGFETKKTFVETLMSFDERGHLDNAGDDLHFYLYTVDGNYYCDDDITRTIARKAAYIEQSWGDGWLFYISRNFSGEILDSCFGSSLGWLIECREEECEITAEEAAELNALGLDVEATAEQPAEVAETDEQEAQEAQEAEQEAQEAQEAEQEAQEAEQTDEQEAEQEAAHRTIYSDCTPCYTPAFAYDISHARTEAEQQAFLERAAQTDAPASETADEESWFCGCTTTPIDPDTANQEADTAALSREKEDRLYQECAAQQAAQKAKRRPITAFLITLIILIVCISSAGTIAHALTTTADALTAPATATGANIMATRIPAQKQTTTTATPAATTPTPTPTPTTPTTPAATPATTTAPTLAQLLARALEAQKTAQTAPQTQEAPQTTKESLSLKTALKRALMAPKTGTTECVIYSTLYASIRIEEVTTPTTETPEEAQEEAQDVSKSPWTFQADTRRIAFMRELRNVTRGRAYNEQITALLQAIDAEDDDYIWKTAAFSGLPEDLKKAIRSQFEAKECTDAEREECRTALDPHAERVTLHTAAIETAAEMLARTAPEWTPILFEETPAPATLRTAILELQYCIFPIDSSPRARVFRGLEGIDFKTLSTPADYQAACKAASLRAGEPSTAIPPEARARIMQWRSGTISTSATAVTSTAARLAAVWGMD